MAKLIVIVRDLAPLAVLQEPVSHRKVEIELTPAQVQQLDLRETGVSCGIPIHEQVSMCFLELDE